MVVIFSSDCTSVPSTCPGGEACLIRLELWFDPVEVVGKNIAAFRGSDRARSMESALAGV